MKKYSVCIEKTSYASHVITITARNEKAARAKAIKEVHSLLYDEYGAEYRIDHAEEVECLK